MNPKAKLRSSLLLLAASSSLLGVSRSHAATYTWDSGNTANGATIDPANGIWNTTAGNIVWNDSGTNRVWAQTSATAALHTAVFGGADGTYAITVGANIAAQKIIFSNSGYTLSAGSARTLTLTATAGAGIQPQLAVASGKTATIGSNVTIASSGTLYLGADSANAGGTLNIEGGTVAPGVAARSVVIDGAGSIVNLKTGGLISLVSGTGNGGLAVGQFLGSDATLNVQGGNATVLNTGTGGLLVGNSGKGTVTLASGTITINSTATNGVTFGSNAANVSSNVLNLDGGTLTTSIVRKGAGTGSTATFNFNGGELVANASSATFMEGLDFAYVKSGGAKINTGANDTTIAQNLLDGTGGGGLTKSGSGKLTLTGTNTYTGTTTISNGTLALGASGSIATSATISVGTGTAFDVSNVSGYTLGASQTLSGDGEVNGAVVVDGRIAPGTGGIGTLTANKSVTWNSGTSWEFDLSNVGSTSDKLALSGAGADGVFTKGTGGTGTFAFDFLGSQPIWNTTYTLATFASSTFSLSDFNLAGSIASLGSGSYGTSYFTLNGTSLQFTAVPEPSTALGGLLLTAGLLRRRRNPFQRGRQN